MFSKLFAKVDQASRAATIEAAVAEFKQTEHWAAVRTCPTETGLAELIKWVKDSE